MFGNPETTTGGRALKFYASVRVDIRRIAAIKDGDNVIGSRTRSRSSRTRPPRPSAKPSSTSCTARASRARVTCSIWPSSKHRREVRRLVQLQRRAHRAGTRKRQAVPERGIRTSPPASKRGAQSDRTARPRRPRTGARLARAESRGRQDCRRPVEEVGRHRGRPPEAALNCPQPQDQRREGLLSR